MLKIIEKNKKKEYDYLLEKNIELYGEDWNGNKYLYGYQNGIETEHEYIPVYRWQFEHIDIEKLEENTEEWQKAIEIIGFEEM